MRQRLSEVKNGKVLFVDDEINIQKLFVASYEAEFDIKTASNGEEGLGLLQDNDFDIIVSDQRMPIMSGIEFLKEARAIYPHQERIILTGYTEYDVLVKAINECGIYYFFSKPWDHHALRLSLISAVQKVNLRKRNESLIKALVEANESLERNSRNVENGLLQNINRLSQLNDATKEPELPETNEIQDQQQLTTLNKKLLTYTLRLNQKKKVLEQIYEYVSSLPPEVLRKDEIRKVIRIIEGQLRFENEWENFETYFNAIKPEFIRGLKQNYPDLSQHELKLCSLISMNISAKNLALVLNVSKESVNTARYRLRQKLGLDKEEKLDDFLILYGRQ